MNEAILVFLQELQRDGFSYYVFWRADHGQHVLHVVGPKRKYDKSLSGENLEALAMEHRRMLYPNLVKKEDISDFM